MAEAFIAQLEAANEIEWVPDLAWSTEKRLIEGKRCRLQSGKDFCKEPAVAALNRSRIRSRKRWWTYCGDHLYSRRLIDGVIHCWQVRR